MLAMKKKIKDLNNKFRVLLTEVLPYELPLVISNQYFYENMQNEDLYKWFCNFMKSNTGLYIPFNYYVRRNGGKKSRLLSIMHPIVQLDVVDFYESFDDYMLYLCSISPFSLRHIEKKAQCMFLADEAIDKSDLDSGNSKIEMDKDVSDYDETKYKSYFTYKDYDMSFRFFEGFEYFRIEQKFRFLRTLDVASCFYHIYTHSIAWAVKGKSYAKKYLRSNSNNVFESCFDNLMQSMNYKETNGILVGPEISRIFAEIIFQRIDLNVLERLKNERSLALHKDFEIKRYVDDHLIFAVEEKTLDIIEDTYQDELEKYKLYLNSGKTETIERPFVSNITVSKALLREHFMNFQNGMENKEKKTFHSILGRKDFAKYLYDFRVVAKQNSVTYDTLNRYQLVLFKNFISNKIVPSFENDAEEKDPNLLYNILEICFYVFSLDMSTTASYRICRIIEQIHKLSLYDKNVQKEVEQIIIREIKRCLDIYMVNSSDEDTNMEVMNLLLTLDGIVGTVFDCEFLKKLFGLEDNKDVPCERLNYFQICTLMQLIKDDGQFDCIKNDINREMMRRFEKNKDDWKSDTELTMLLFDWISCPYVMTKDKDDLLTIAGCSAGNASKTRKKIVEARKWFFDWDGCKKLDGYISKKEYHNIYE